jgi:hypothetical protein
MNNAWTCEAGGCFDDYCKFMYFIILYVHTLLNLSSLTTRILASISNEKLTAIVQAVSRLLDQTTTVRFQFQVTS